MAYVQGHLPFKTSVLTPRLQIFEADPLQLDINQVSTFILSFLRPMPSDFEIEAHCPKLSAFRYNINEKLPRELQTTLLKYLRLLWEDVVLEPIGFSCHRTGSTSYGP